MSDQNLQGKHKQFHLLVFMVIIGKIEMPVAVREDFLGSICVVLFCFLFSISILSANIADSDLQKG